MNFMVVSIDLIFFLSIFMNLLSSGIVNFPRKTRKQKTEKGEMSINIWFVSGKKKVLHLH